MAKKRKHPGLTERRMNNKRFRKTEEAILKAFFECGQYADIRKVARRAKCARTTVYYHHTAVREILADHKRYIMRKHSRMMRPILAKKQARLRNMYLTNLTFIVTNRQIFLMLAKLHDREVLQRMIEGMRMKIEGVAKMPRNSERAFRVYQGEIVAVLEEWGREGFNESEILQTLDQMMYLTDTMRERLKPLMK